MRLIDLFESDEVTEESLLANNEIEIVYETADIRITKFMTLAAAKYYAKCTRWVFAKSQAGFANAGNTAGIYVIARLNHSGYPSYCVLCGNSINFKPAADISDTQDTNLYGASLSVYFRNMNNDVLDHNELVALYTQLPHFLIKMSIQFNPTWIRFISNPAIDIQLISVKNAGRAIQYIPNPPPMIQSAACSNDPNAVNWITPIESIDISLLRKYKDILNEPRLAYLMSIDQTLTESTKSTDPNTWTEAEQIAYVKEYWSYIRNITNPILEVQLAAVQQTGDAIYYITNPCLEVQLAAVQQNGGAICHITNPTIPVQLAAVQQAGGTICYITNPTPLIQTAACFQDPTAINEINPIESTNIGLMKKYRDSLNAERLAYLERIENESLTESTKTPVIDDNSRFVNKWSEAKQIEFVKQNYENIKRIKHPSEAVQLAAVQRDGFAIQYITNPSLEVQLAAVQQTGDAIYYITNPCLEVQLAAVKQDGWAIYYIKDPCLEVQLAAVQANGYAIQHITNPSIPVQLAAVQQNGRAIYYITVPRPMIQAAALRQNPLAINNIDPEWLDPGLKEKYKEYLNK